MDVRACRAKGGKKKKIGGCVCPCPQHLAGCKGCDVDDVLVGRALLEASPGATLGGQAVRWFGGRRGGVVR